MIQNNLLNSSQSGFRPIHSSINQLISITQNIYRTFDANPSLELQCVFLEFFYLTSSGMKVFYNLKNKGINGNALQLIEPFLK